MASDSNDNFKKLIGKMKAREKKITDKYKKLKITSKPLGISAKCHNWLRFWAENGDNYGDQEALIYLKSRGCNCDDLIDDLIYQWKLAANSSIDMCSKGVPYASVDADNPKHNNSNAAYIAQIPLAEAKEITPISTLFLPDFWGCTDNQRYSIDATMLRTVEWCEIGGFDKWWDRLAKQTSECIVRDGVDPIIGSYHLFYMCRSNLAISLMRQALNTALCAIEMTGSNQSYPWTHLHPVVGRNSDNHIPNASSIVFGNIMLRDDQQRSPIVKEALNFLLSEQHADGYWRCWANDESPCIEATAMSLHAISFGKPRGWKRAAQRASEWLWSIQENDGYWTESGAPDPVLLTVLVLDAIELAKESTKCTFKLNNEKELELKKKKKTKQNRFTVALSFPGESRQTVEPVADLLASKYGKDKVLYDKYHAAELARINLDSYLQQLYHDESSLIVVFFCENYQKKRWCGIEWRAIRDLIETEKSEQIMLLRIDKSKMSGVFSIDGYIDIAECSSTEIYDYIVKRIEN